MVALALLTLLAFAAQCKAGPPWKYTLTYRLLRLLCRVVCRFLRLLGALLRGLPLLWKSLLGMAAVTAALLLLSLQPNGPRFMGTLLLMGILTLAVLYLTLDLRRLQQAGEMLAQ